MKNNKIQKGDRIKVTVNDFTAAGIVESAQDWGNNSQSDWYIEMRDSLDHKIRYVKEQLDHAVIEKL